jgi:hypothetical protein
VGGVDRTTWHSGEEVDGQGVHPGLLGVANVLPLDGGGGILVFENNLLTKLCCRPFPGCEIYFTMKKRL